MSTSLPGRLFLLMSARGIPEAGDASQEPGRRTEGQRRLVPALPLCEQVQENPVSRKIWPCTRPGPLPGCLARCRWRCPGGGSQPGGSVLSPEQGSLRALSTQTQPGRQAKGSHGSNASTPSNGGTGVLEMTRRRGAETLRDAPGGCECVAELFSLPRVTNVTRGHAQPPRLCCTSGKREAAVRSPRRLHCGLKDGSVSAAIAKRLRQAAALPSAARGGRDK